VKLGKKYLAVWSYVLWIGKSFPNLSFIVLRPTVDLRVRDRPTPYFGGEDTKVTPTCIGACVVGSTSASALVQAVERHKHRRRCPLLAARVEEVDQVHVEGAELAVQDERAGGKLRHCAGDVAETGDMIATVAADETYVLAALVGDQASAVVPLSYTQPARWNGARTSVGCIGEMVGRSRLDTADHCIRPPSSCAERPGRTTHVVRCLLIRGVDVLDPARSITLLT
jgi:hypothetical protein